MSRPVLLLIRCFPQSTSTFRQIRQASSSDYAKEMYKKWRQDPRSVHQVGQANCCRNIAIVSWDFIGMECVFSHSGGSPRSMRSEDYPRAFGCTGTDSILSGLWLLSIQRWELFISSRFMVINQLKSILLEFPPTIISLLDYPVTSVRSNIRTNLL